MYFFDFFDQLQLQMKTQCPNAVFKTSTFFFSFVDWTETGWYKRLSQACHVISFSSMSGVTARILSSNSTPQFGQLLSKQVLFGLESVWQSVSLTKSTLSTFVILCWLSARTLFDTLKHKSHKHVWNLCRLIVSTCLGRSWRNFLMKHDHSIACEVFLLSGLESSSVHRL